MLRHNIYAAACVLGVLAGSAAADVIFPFGSSGYVWKESGKTSGNVNLGYSSKYISRGLSLQDSSTDNIGSAEASIQYALPNHNAILLGARFDWFSNNGTSHYKQPDTATLKQFINDWRGKGGYREYDLENPLCDEGTVTLQFAHYFKERTVLAFGYEFVHGGLPGRLHTTDYENKLRALDRALAENDKSLAYAEESKRAAFCSRTAEEHSLALDFHHEFSPEGKGFFYDARVRYAVQWESGWWLTNTVGYRKSLNDWADLVLSASWSATINYFDGDSVNGNGTQGYVIGAAAPLRLSDRIYLTPHVNGVFIGNGARKAKGKLMGHTLRYNEDGIDYELLVGHHLDYRDFTVEAGLTLSYVF